MYDPWGTYHSLEEALKVGRVLEQLDFAWYEHPMPEYRVESYVRLARELTIPFCHRKLPLAACSPGRSGSCAAPPT